MEYIYRISTNNYTGYTADITFNPSTGGTINIGTVTLPYDYPTDYPYGDYYIYIPATGVSGSLNNPPPTP
jgi:hypothetical protein